MSSRKYTTNSNIVFCVERYLDPETKQYRVVTEQDNADNVHEIELDIAGTFYSRPGNFNCLPEDAYPPESECEIVGIKWNGKVWDGELTEDETEKVLDLISENESMEVDDHYDDDDDDDRGDWQYADEAF